jgi:hypothetical protein
VGRGLNSHPESSDPSRRHAIAKQTKQRNNCNQAKANKGENKQQHPSMTNYMQQSMTNYMQQSNTKQPSNTQSSTGNHTTM